MRLTTPRLILRPFTLDDFDALRAIDGDPEILRYRSRRVIQPGDTRAWLRQAEIDALHPDTPDNPRRQYAFAAVLPYDATQVIVQLGLTRALTLAGEVALDEAYLWYSTLRAQWGHGYAAEVARALLAFGFEQVGLGRIFAECHPENVASRRVMDKLGLRPEAHRPEEDERYPERIGFYRAALNAGEWSVRRGNDDAG
jgi:RimJ/RimL family protein N-acetyltransferase